MMVNGVFDNCGKKSHEIVSGQIKAVSWWNGTKLVYGTARIVFIFLK